MNTIIFLSLDEIISAHQNQVDLYGGSHGIRDLGRLESAINMPSTGFGDRYIHADIFEMAAAYAYHIIKNDPFIDGNKRTGMIAAFLFFGWNDIDLDLPEDTIVEIGVKIATSELSKEGVADIFRKNCLYH